MNGPETAAAPSFALRPAGPDDAHRLYDWRNDEFIVERSTSRRKVTEAEHHAWFAATLADADRRLAIVEIGGEAAGLVRFDRTGGIAVISVYLLEPYTGAGYGTRAIAEATDAILKDWGGAVHAHVRAENAAGQKSFLRAGFAPLPDGASIPDGHVGFVRTAAAPAELAGWHADDAADGAYYDDRVRRFGHDARAADWGSRESQQRRFQIFAELVPLRGRRILDVGCGTGAFYGWLREQGIEVDYTGVDVAADMVAAARAQFPAATFVQGSVLGLGRLAQPAYDHVFASGIFARRRHAPLEFFAAAVETMFAACRYSASLNSLSAWAARQEDGEFHIDPAFALGVARRHTPRVILRHDYRPGDFTLHLVRAAT